jgi:hypothetical protein
VEPYSIREILLWIGGMLVAVAITTILGVIDVLDNYLAVHDPSDPLTAQGGLKPNQAPALGKVTAERGVGPLAEQNGSL